MSAYVFIEPGASFSGVSNTGTFATASGVPAPLAFGIIAGARDPTYGYGEFMFVQGPSASAPTAGDACLIQGGIAQQAASGNTASQGPIGIAPAAISATTFSTLRVR